MKIALLTLQYDNNYGGNLQRFALMTILQKLGHDVTDLHLIFRFFPDSKIQYLKNIFFRIFQRIKIRKPIEVFVERHNYQRYINSCRNTSSFFYRYIKHSKAISSPKQLNRYINFDAFVVGSDQVWRKKFTCIYGIDTFFFNFLPPHKTNRIAYGVSFGSDEKELTAEDITRLTVHFNSFKKVSVREESAIQLLKEYKWDNKNAEVVLDPTLLLSAEDYNKIILENETQELPGNVFCYILDSNEEKKIFISNYCAEHQKKAFYCSLGTISIPQWLKSFKDSDFIITDSYHGVIFALIYNKPFHLFSNEFRGNTRFSSLESLLSLKFNQENYNWPEINSKISTLKEKSISFLRESFNEIPISTTMAEH